MPSYSVSVGPFLVGSSNHMQAAEDAASLLTRPESIYGFQYRVTDTVTGESHEFRVTRSIHVEEN